MEKRRKGYNNNRPHSSLGYLSLKGISRGEKKKKESERSIYKWSKYGGRPCSYFKAAIFGNPAWLGFRKLMMVLRLSSKRESHSRLWCKSGRSYPAFYVKIKVFLEYYMFRSTNFFTISFVLIIILLLSLSLRFFRICMY